MKLQAGLALALGGALALSAQQTETVTAQAGVVVHDVVVAAPEAGATMAAPATFQFFSAGEMPGGAVKGQPYSAEATTEVVRVLTDGTRISNKNTSSMARDKEGRTRRENTLANIGPWATAGQQPPKTVTISDPVAKTVFLVNPDARTVRKMPSMPMPFEAARLEGGPGKHQITENRVFVRGEAMGAGAAGGTWTAAVPATPVPPPPPGAAHTMMMTRIDPTNVKRENLGRQNMEGVMVEGTRETMTTPAGQIGNDRPIIATTESWFSPELQIMIYTHTVDPQFGETTYRVSNLRRTEPSADLFQVPADYKVLEMMNAIPRTRRLKE